MDVAPQRVACQAFFEQECLRVRGVNIDGGLSMSWTLWRGADLLGTVYPRSIPDAVQEHKNRREVNAVLVPDPTYLPLQSVHQYVTELGGSELVRELVREPHITRLERRVDNSSGLTVGIWPVAIAPAPTPPGVPPAHQLRIRDRDGRILATRSIGLLEHRPHPAHPPTELATLPDGAFVGGSIWLVHFTQDLTTP
jgi:hypothetical protein